MRSIGHSAVVEAVEALCLQAACDLPGQTRRRIAGAREAERSPRARAILAALLENARIAAEERLPICQDTGVAVFFVELGEQARVAGLREAIEEGTRRGYRRGWLRSSLVRDPLFDRTNTGDNTPAVVHLELVPGDRLAITLAPKGGGSENMSRLAMLKPLAGEAGVIDFAAAAVIEAGGNPCPPTVVGVGIGGTFELAALLAKKALVREAGEPHPDPRYAALERAILERVNASGVGPQGLGGSTTALAVHVLAHPCHIASLPVAVNLNCHAARHARVVL